MSSSDSWPVILITGVSSGIGRALARLLWRKEYRVVATARQTSLTKIADEDFREDDRFLLRALDVTDPAQRDAVVQEIEERWGGVAILINNAGISYRSVVEHMTDDDEMLQVNTNFLAPMALVRLVLPRMRRARSGHIINVSSVGGMMAMPTMGSYSASKFALEGATEALWYEMKPWDVRVTLVQPGFINSNSFRNVYWSEKARAAVEHRGAYSNYYEHIGPFIEKLMTRAIASPESVAEHIVRVIERRDTRLRVPVTFDAYVFSMLRRLLPNRLYHWVLHRNLPGIKTWGRSGELR